MFGSTIPLKTLAQICRSMATMLHSGVPIVKTIATVAPRFGSAAVQRQMREVSERLKMGDDVRSAFEASDGFFPELFVDMIAIAEETGSLPEVLKNLAEHYESLLRMRRDFISQITMPILQLIAAICIISLVIFVLGMIADSQGSNPIDVFGLGLTGTSGAAIFFFGSFGSLAALFFLYKFLIVGFRQQRLVHEFLLRVPVIGQCLQSFAIARFSWAFALTQQAGMNVLDSLTASLKATANQAFVAETPRMTGLVRQGEDLSTAIIETGLFTAEFEQMVQVAETSGTVPEMLEHLSPQFEDSARRSLKTLATAFGWGVWALVAAFIIFAIFRLASFYVGMINTELKNI